MFAPSRTRPSPKAPVAYVCGEGANVESRLARRACEHSIVRRYGTIACADDDTYNLRRVHSEAACQQQLRCAYGLARTSRHRACIINEPHFVRTIPTWSVRSSAVVSSQSSSIIASIRQRAARRRWWRPLFAARKIGDAFRWGR